MTIRRPAVAGTWYPKVPGALAQEVDGYLAAAADGTEASITALIVPHAGIMFSGPVAAFGYKAAARHQYDVAVLVGPSHFQAFEGVALFPDGAFETPLGSIPIDTVTAAAIGSAECVSRDPSVHTREHSLEMQLPFLGRLFPGLPIVPLLMGEQHRPTIEALAPALARSVENRRALLIASTDLSHYYDAETAEALDGAVCGYIEAFDPEGLLDRFEQCAVRDRGRRVGCGIGPAIAVMKAARLIGASSARVLRYGHSGQVSGDHDAVVGYVAATFGTANVH